MRHNLSIGNYKRHKTTKMGEQIGGKKKEEGVELTIIA